MKKIYGFILLAAAALMLSGCVSMAGGRAVSGSGPMVLHEIPAQGFTGLYIGGGYDLTFHQAPEFSVSIEVQENLFNYLEAQVRSGVLHLSFSRNITTTPGNTPRVRVYAPYLDSLSVRGAVNANMDLHVSRLDIDISGAGNLTLVGSADVLDINAGGAANINAFDMIARDVLVNMNGAGNADVYASNTLDVDISGVGRVRYDGDPVVTRNITGLGSISRRN